MMTKMFFCYVYGYYILLAIQRIFGVFNAKYFTYESALYGLSGSIIYTCYLLFRRISEMANDTKMAKPFNKFEIWLLFLRPFMSTFLAFVLAGGANMLFGTGSIFAKDGGAFIIGIVCGLFIEYIASKDFEKRIWNEKIEPKIFKKDNE